MNETTAGYARLTVNVPLELKQPSSSSVLVANCSSAST